MPPFVELMAKSCYSFLEGASFPEEMVQKAAELGYEGMAIVDKNGVYGAPRAHSEARARGFHLIVGAELLLECRRSTQAERNALPAFSSALKQRAVLLARNRHGYGDLCELLSEAHQNGERHLKACDRRSSTLLSRLQEKSEDLYCLIPAVEAEESLLSPLKSIFGPRLYLAAHCFHDGKDSLNTQTAETLSQTFDLPCIASNQPLFHDKERKPLQDVLTCIHHTTTLEEAGFKLLPNRERHLKTKAEIAANFPGHGEWLENTVRIAEDCRFSLSELRYHYPTEWIPPGETGDSYLEKLTWENARRRYSDRIPEKIDKLLQKELSLIRELGYSDYFLTVFDIVQFAQREAILCQGRGSAANSAVCFVLGITSLNPNDTEVLFERFLSRERKEPPDIDIDFEHERREEVIQYIYQRYGRDRAAITAEVICFRRKSAFREVGKVFGLPEAAVVALQRLTHRRELDTVREEELAKLAPGFSRKRLQLFFHLSQELLGFPRHLGTHVGGFVLCQDHLNRHVPIEKAAMDGRTIIQWDKNDLDALGFVKVDILGLGILTAIRKSFALLEGHGLERPNLYDIPTDDKDIFDSLCQADTVGVFQIESRAQMNMLPRLKPREFYDLVVEISLVRPGPIQGGMVHPYLKRRAQKEKVEYLHPELESILKRTLGVPLFQEQIMQIAITVAGFSPGEADELRRAMGSWRHRGDEPLRRMSEKLKQGLMKKGLPEDYADRIFKQIAGFAEYGFPESHAASFAILANATAWLKFYHPAVFLTALLNSQPMGFYSARTLIHDGQRHGVKVLPIDVQSSQWDNLCPNRVTVRLGFRQIRGFCQRVAEALTQCRGSGFSSFHDLVARLKKQLGEIPLSRRDLFFLAAANAFDSLGMGRRIALWEIQALSLPDARDFSPEEARAMLPREGGWERINLDYDAQGLSLFAHPMGYLREELRTAGVMTSREIATARPTRQVRAAGIVVSRQMPPTASGVLFITLEDELGFTNLVIWRNVFEKFRDVLLSQSFLTVTGTLQKAEDGNVIHVIVERAEPLLQSPHSLPSHDFH